MKFLSLTRLRPNDPKAPSLVFTFLLAAALLTLVLLYLGAFAASVIAVGIFATHFLQGTGGLLQGGLLVLGMAVMSLLTMILGKGLFRRHGVDRREFIELTEETDPEFFAFLRDLCYRAEAKMPHRVFACPDVNAGVFFDLSFWNVVVPTRKNLLVGLGMVEALNRTEFEAVLAHEFGHFSQFSMRLSHYVQVVSAILDGMTHEKDRVDKGIQSWQEGWHRGFLVGPLFLFLSKVMRTTGVLLRKSLRVLDSKVSRDMELHADAVAVRLTGSDALIHALCRTDWAERCYSQTLYDLEQAARQGYQSDDLYFHQRHLSEKMRHRLGDPNLGIPPNQRDDGEGAYPAVFPIPEGFSWDSKGETHPPHHVREAFARANYQRSHFDNRSAWSFFEHPRQLRETLTGRLYESRWGLVGQVTSAANVQAFLDGEHEEIVLSPREQAVYGHRFLEPGDLQTALKEARETSLSDSDLRSWLNKLQGPLLEEAARRIARHIEGPRSPVAAGAKGLRGRTRREEEEPSGDPQDDRQWLARWDRDLTVARLALAFREDENQGKTLLGRYAFHLHLQDLIRWMRGNSANIGMILETLDQENVDPGTLKSLFEGLLTLHEGYRQGLQEAPEVPELHGLTRKQGLEALILKGPLLSAQPLRDGELSGEWLQEFLDSWQEGIEGLQHLRLKSLGALLARIGPS